ncbi:DUF6705 family protein [Chryseobacterium aquaticum]|uniref:DUF6705 family protein n=1 Tax=Chryseobacterium aquaticum TaxID=452084 RepID=UPI003F704D8F
MKKYILILLLVAVSCTAQSQQPILRTLSFQECFSEDYSYKHGDYVKDFQNQLDPYIGTWKYEGNGMVLILKLQKVPMFYEDISKTYRDELLLTYKFIKDGVVLVDNLNAPVFNDFDSITKEERKKYGVYSFSSDMQNLDGSITDIPLNILASSYIYPINPNVNGTFNQIKIEYNGMDAIRGNPKSFYVGKPTFILPNRVVLIRQ